MSKIFSSVLVLLASSVALAYPTIGDQALLKGTATSGGMTANVSLDRSIKDFDASSNSYVVVETQSVDGQEATATSVMTADELISKAQVDMAITYCAQAGGTSESLTVPAGTFATCKMEVTDENNQPSGHVWIADVAFGIAKYSNTEADGTSYTLELESFHSAR